MTTTDTTDTGASPPDDALTVRVNLRDFTIADAVRPAPVDGGHGGPPLWFLPMDAPPPVGALLVLLERTDEPKAASWTLEVRHSGRLGDSGPSGCLGRRVDSARLHESRHIGSEHLRPVAPRRSTELAQALGAPATIVITSDTPNSTPLAAGGGKLRKGRTRA